MFFKAVTVLLLVQVMHLYQSVLGCPHGKGADVVLFLDTSPHLNDNQFENQIQRAEVMVRLFRNYDNDLRKKYNRIAIVTISDSTVKHIIRFKKTLKSSDITNTDELVHVLRTLKKTQESGSTSDSRKRKHELLALKQLKRLSSQMRKEVAHVAFYFSRDETVSRVDLKRAKFIRRLGIYLYIFRLGPSQITYDQYKKMVNEPVSDFVFDVKAYSDIDASVKKLLDMTHCDLQVSPPDESPRPICAAKRQVNLLLGIDPITFDGSSSTKIQHFVGDLRKELEKTNKDKIVIEEVYNDFKPKPSEIVKTFPDYNDLLIKINKTAASLSTRKERKSAQNTLLLFLDSNSYETKEMIRRAVYIKDHKTEIYAVVMGKKGTTFQDIVSKPADSHLIRVEDVEQLTSRKEEILKLICVGW